MCFPDQYKISVIIPTLNGEATLPELFAALALQDITVDEILVGDSASEDRTVEICVQHGARVIPVPRKDFDHGGTRTLLAQKAVGDLLVYFTQDTVLSRPEALKNLIQPLLVAGSGHSCTYGRQLPAPGASLLAAHLRSFNYPATSQTRSYADRLEYGLKTIFISNSFAAYKKEDLCGVGFFKNGLIFGEDTCTLGRLLLTGTSVCYVSEAAVYHSHNYYYSQEFKRSFDIGVLHSAEKWLLETYGHAEGLGKIYVRSALDEIISQKKYTLILDWFIRNTVKFIGYKLGRTYDKLPKKICPSLSLNRRWWG
ncbi:MAG: glycosyl transferase [Desulfotalea sp.]|nr:MAG: glycosyl transferase [Desulfotalea sp.]